MQLLCNKYISVEMCFLSHYKKYCIVVCNYHCVATRSESVHFYGVAFILEGDTFLMPKNLKKEEMTKMTIKKIKLSALSHTLFL